MSVLVGTDVGNRRVSPSRRMVSVQPQSNSGAVYLLCEHRPQSAHLCLFSVSRHGNVILYHCVACEYKLKNETMYNFHNRNAPVCVKTSYSSLMRTKVLLCKYLFDMKQFLVNLEVDYMGSGF